MNGEAISKAGNGENPQYPLPRRGEQQVTPGLPGVLAATRQRCHAAGVDELQPRQVHDDPLLARRDSPEGSRPAVAGSDGIMLLSRVPRTGTACPVVARRVMLSS